MYGISGVPMTGIEEKRMNQEEARQFIRNFVQHVMNGPYCLERRFVTNEIVLTEMLKHFHGKLTTWVPLDTFVRAAAQNRKISAIFPSTFIID